MSYSYSEIEETGPYPFYKDQTTYPVENGSMFIRNEVDMGVPTGFSTNNHHIMLSFTKKIEPITISPEQEIYKHRAKELVKKATAKITEVRQYLLKQAGIMVEGQFNQRLPAILWKEIKSYLEKDHPFKLFDKQRFPLYKYYNQIRCGIPEKRDGKKGRNTDLVVLQMPVLLCNDKHYDVCDYLKDEKATRYVWVRMMWKKLLSTDQRIEGGKKIVEKRLLVQLQPLSIAEACIEMDLASKGAIELQNPQPFNTVIQIFAIQQDKVCNKNLFVKWGFKKISQTSVESAVSGSFTPDRSDTNTEEIWGSLLKKHLVKFKTKQNNKQCVLVPHTMNYKCKQASKDNGAFNSRGQCYTIFRLHTEYLDLRPEWDYEEGMYGSEINYSRSKIQGFYKGDWYSFADGGVPRSLLIDIVGNIPILEEGFNQKYMEDYVLTRKIESSVWKDRPLDKGPFNRYKYHKGYIAKYQQCDMLDLFERTIGYLS